MSQYLFAYGTLQPGLAPESMAAAVHALLPIGEGYVRGTLYDLGHYPGAVLDPLSDRRIHGRVFRLPDDPAILGALDEYEEFFPANLEASQFVRVLSSVTLGTGGALECWVYVYNLSVEFLPEVAGGKFGSK